MGAMRINTGRTGPFWCFLVLAGGCAFVTDAWAAHAEARERDRYTVSIDTAISGNDALPAAADTSQALRSARARQRSFERLRRRHMPRGQYSVGRNCDEVVGRFCYRVGNRYEGRTELPEERAQVTNGRVALIAALDSFHAVYPTNPWIEGQRVRYMIEAGLADTALQRLSSCETDAWWCEALHGLAYHSLGRYVDAEAVFDNAMTLTDSTTRCRWNDVSVLLDPSDRRSYRDHGCEDREALHASIWWLAEPLYMVPGNERKTEHFARQTMIALQAAAEDPGGVSWGRDLDELTLRLGWPAYWSRSMNPASIMVEVRTSYSAHHWKPSYHFLPSLEAAIEPMDATEDAWNLWPRYSREEFSPRSITLGAIEQQTAVFMRGPDAHVVARIDISGDSIMQSHASGQAGIVLVSGPNGERAISTTAWDQSIVRDGILVRSTAAARDWMASIEALSAEGRATRARFAVPRLATGAGGRSVSDILIFNPRDELPESLADAERTMRSSLVVPQGSTIGLYWELYDLKPMDAVQISLTGTPIGSGALRRIGQALGLVGRDGALRASWSEGPERPAAILPRSLAVDISSLRRGRHELELHVVINSEEPIVRRRVIEVR